MLSLQGNCQIFYIAIKPPVSDQTILLFIYFYIASQTVKFRAAAQAYAFQNLQNFFLFCRCYTNAVSLDDSRFFAGNLFQSIAQIGRMIESNIGDDGNKRLTNICRVQPTAQTDLQHGNNYFLIFKIFKGNGC